MTFYPLLVHPASTGTLSKAFQNRITSHNEVDSDHTGRGQRHGRVWRVRHRCQPQRALQDFLLAPAETKSLAAVRLTAVSAPNEAIEQAFRLFRIELKNGSRPEGFKAGEDGNEVTLRLMGGGAQKVSHGEIQSAGYIDGRSVTPPVAAGLQDLQVAEIVAYLRAFG